MFKIALGLLSLVLLVSCTKTPEVSTPQISPEVRSDLAPTGKLRAGINYGNPVLAQKDPTTGDLRGVTADLSRELGRRLGVPVELVPYDSAGAMAAAAKTGVWDIAFLAIDPERAADISFTAPYVEIEGTYLVPAGSPLQTIAEVDREGARIAVGAKSGYDLFLTRELKHAQLVRAPSSQAAIDQFVADKLEVTAGVKQALVAASAKIPGSRVLEGRFMVIQQAAGVPKGHDAGARYLHEFIEDAKASGLVAQGLKDSGVEGASVAPKAPVQ